MTVMGLVSSYRSPPIQFIGGILGTVLTSGVTSVTFTGHAVGDLLLVLGGSQQSADPSYTAGWTRITSYNSTGTLRVGIILYKWATSTGNDVITFTGTGSSTIRYSSGHIFRNVLRIGNSNVVTGTSANGSTLPSPSLTLSDTRGGSALVLATYNAGIGTAPNSMTVSAGMAYGLQRSSWPGGNFTTASGVNLANCGIVELVGSPA